MSYATTIYPTPGDWLTIDGQPLPPNTTWALQIRTITQVITSGMTVREPDPEWLHFDGNGHPHAWARPIAGDSRPWLPTLTQSVERTPCPGGFCCDGGDDVVEREVYHCTTCGEAVQPGMKAKAGPWSRSIVTGIEHTLTVTARAASGPPPWLLPEPGPIAPPTYRPLPVYGVLGGVFRFGSLTADAPTVNHRRSSGPDVTVELTGALHDRIGSVVPGPLHPIPAGPA